ncbi:luciferase family oxidoreductase group 1 [Salirhabdus euzebyi]|uniref:Luciferase family oxidoreductase group 1 n=1 Tax=Salirhabdus euzebyi TaxID=394506 RepID=A0A841Q6X3_9BACI|nr:LLM class flavin-dependent oxidoreductase [Salirhabdus euzebyi]MBB6454161.1 luciferase family oxidoreductase group 1 [Salirhabdus euzebyi]
MNIKLSVLDQSPILRGYTAREALQQTTTLAKWTDQLGYHRFWVSEHHSTKSLAGSAPEILVTHLAANTQHIRIGTGGVLLPHYSAFKIAEVFQVLEALYPNRIDLGIGRAPGGMPGVNYALNDGKYRNVREYPTQVKELMSYLQGIEHPHYKIQATPLGKTKPPIWMLGSSGTSAALAAQLGTSYTFAQFINGEGGIASMQTYFNQFQPSMYQQKPDANVAIFIICAETQEEAEFIAGSMDLALLRIENGDIRDHFPTPEEAQEQSYTVFEKERIEYNRNRMIVGDPKQVKDGILKLAEMYQVDEVIMNTFAPSFEERLKSYQLIMNQFGNIPKGG